MRLTIILGFFSGGALAAGACSWFLEADDCICMNSTNGELLKKQTATICKSMGYQLWGDVCAVDRAVRQDFKDACKDLKQTSVIGHCR